MNVNLRSHLTKDFRNCRRRVWFRPDLDDVGQVPRTKFHQNQKLVALPGGLRRRVNRGGRHEGDDVLVR